MSNDDNRGLPNRGRANAYRGYSPDPTQTQKIRFKPIGIDVVGSYVAFGVELYYSYNLDLSDAAPLQGATLELPAYIFPNNADNIYRISYFIDSPDFRGGADYVESSGNFIASGGAIDFSILNAREEHTVGARIETVDGDIGLLTAYCTLANAPITPGIITADRNTNMSLTGKAGSSVPDLVFNLSFSTDETVTYSFTDDASWISGSIAGSELTLSFPGASALAAGAYTATGTVTVSGSEAPAEPLVISINLTVTAADAYTLVYSDSASFTNPFALSNAQLSGSHYIGLLPTAGIGSVAWSLDGVATVTRTGTPFDFGAEASATSAALYDTSVLSNGTHTLSATITPTGGQRNYILQSQTLSTSPWSNFTTTVTTGDTIAGPEGSTLMFISQNTGASATQHTHSQLVAKPASAVTQFNVRAYIKPKSGVEQYYWRMIVGDSSSLTGYCSLYFRLDPGNVGVVSTAVPAGGSSGWSIISSSVVESSVSGVYQVDFVGTTDATANIYPRLTWTSTAGGSSTYAAATATGAYIAWQVDFGAAAMTAYTATTTSQVIGTGGTPVTVSADITASNAPKVLQSDKVQVSFLATAGGSSPDAQTLTITPSIGTAVCSAVELVDMSWLGITASVTASPGTPGTITLTPTLGALAAGQYTGTVRITSPGYQSVDVNIIFNVAPAVATYALYYSTTAVGAADYRLLQGATTQRMFLWLANTATPRTPYTVTANTSDSFKFWNTATTVAEETTKFVVWNTGPGFRVVIGPPTGLVETVGGPKTYHWTLSVSGTVYRGDTTYNYATASAHKTDYGVWLRGDKGGVNAGTLSAAEIAFVQHPACKGIAFQIGWGTIDHNASPGGAFDWTKPDALIALTKSYGKKCIISIVPQGWQTQPPYIFNNTNRFNKSFPGFPWWADPVVSAEWKRMWRAVSARYDDNPDVVGFATDEGWWPMSAAWTALGRSEGANSTAYQALALEILDTIDPAVGKKPFRKTHWFVGINNVFARFAPGGNLDSLVNAGVGAYQPDGLQSGKALGGTQGVLLQYKGRITGLLFGDAYSMASSNLSGTFPNAPMASYKMNADWRVPNSVAEYNPGTTHFGADAANCMQFNYFGIMAVATAVRFPPINPGWNADIAQLLAYVQANGYPNTTSPSNLANKV